jgi:hypothetical protein
MFGYVKLLKVSTNKVTIALDCYRAQMQVRTRVQILPEMDFFKIHRPHSEGRRPPPSNRKPPPTGSRTQADGPPSDSAVAPAPGTMVTSSEDTGLSKPFEIHRRQSAAGRRTPGAFKLQTPKQKFMTTERRKQRDRYENYALEGARTHLQSNAFNESVKDIVRIAAEHERAKLDKYLATCDAIYEGRREFFEKEANELFHSDDEGAEDDAHLSDQEGS